MKLMEGEGCGRGQIAGRSVGAGLRAELCTPQGSVGLQEGAPQSRGSGKKRRGLPPRRRSILERAGVVRCGGAMLQKADPGVRAGMGARA